MAGGDASTSLRGRVVQVCRGQPWADVAFVSDMHGRGMAQAAASIQAAETERRGLARRAISRLAAGLTRSASPPATVALRDLGGGETQPTPRKFHAACSLYPWRPLLVIFGGWQVDRHFDDMWVLAHGGDLVSYGTPDGYGSDDDDEVEIVLQVGGRRERVLIERSTLEALLENGRFRANADGTFAMNAPPAVMMPPGDPETGDEDSSQEDGDEDSSSSEEDDDARVA